MFEQEAATLTRKFGIEKPQDTHGYRLILAALQDAYRRGVAMVTGVKDAGAGEMCQCGLAKVEISPSGENMGACIGCLWDETYTHALGEIGRNSQVGPMPENYKEETSDEQE